MTSSSEVESFDELVELLEQTRDSPVQRKTLADLLARLSFRSSEPKGFSITFHSCSMVQWCVYVRSLSLTFCRSTKGASTDWNLSWRSLCTNRQSAWGKFQEQLYILIERARVCAGHCVSDGESRIKFGQFSWTLISHSQSHPIQ